MPLYFRGSLLADLCLGFPNGAALQISPDLNFNAPLVLTMTQAHWLLIHYVLQENSA